MVVKFSWPLRTSRHTGALLPGWVAWRFCCSCTFDGSAAPGCAAGCAEARPVQSESPTTRQSLERIDIRPPTLFLTDALLADPLVLVLGELPVLDLLFPARAIPLVPLAAAQLRDRRIVVPGPPVGLALVLALLVDDDLRLLAAGAYTHGEKSGGDQRKAEPHDFVAGCGCICAGGLAPGAPGPYAVPQPQTSEPLPRRSTRAR